MEQKNGMHQVYNNYIAGEWRASRSGKTLISINPANREETVGAVQDSTPDDLDEAVQAAREALKSWKRLSPVERGHYLQKAADLLAQRSDEMAWTAMREMGKILPDIKGEVERGITILRFYAQEGLRKMGDLIPSAQSENILFTMRVPLGVVGVITPWNFPVAIPLWKIAPALVCGNTVVFKPAAETAVTAAKLVEIFDEAGLPAGVLNLVTGEGSVIGEGIVNHPGIDGITFTGSNEVGKRVAVGAAARGAKYQLEMGGKNPLIVLKDADLDLAAELTVSGAMKQTGQRCTATSRVFVESAIYEEFKRRVMDIVKRIKVGPGWEEGVYMGPLASQKQLGTVMDYIQAGIKEGATLLCGGNVLRRNGLEKGFFVEPTVFENVRNDMTIAQEEIFGPVLCLIKVDCFEEALQQANDTRYGLSASLFTRDLTKAFQFIKEIDAGMVKINGETAGVEPQAPFGGLKESSSYSRELGQAAMEFFTTVKTATITAIP